MKKIVSNIISISLALITAWMLGSFVEVASKNLSANPQYSKVNFFCILAENY